MVLEGEDGVFSVNWWWMISVGKVKLGRENKDDEKESIRDYVCFLK